MNKKIYLSALCALAINLSAQDLGTIQVESSTIDEKNSSLQTEVSSVSKISGEEIEELNPQKVADILNTIPGVTLTNAGTDALKVHIRGVDNQMYMGEKPGVAIIVDGVPVQETTGKINVDLDNIASIKVIKGGASYLYGNDAIAGAVIITTKRAKGKDSYRVETEAGSFGSKRVLAALNHSFENSALQIQGSHRHTDGYWEDAFVTVSSINGKYQYYIDDSSDVTFGVDFTKRETGDGNSVSGTIEAEENPTSEGYYSYGGYYNSDLTKAFMTYSKDIDSNSNFMLRLHSYEDDKNYKLARYTKDMFEIWGQNGAKGEFKTSFDNLAVMAGFDIQMNTTDEVSYDIVDGKDPKFGTDGDKLADFDTKENIYALYTELKHQTTKDLTTTFNLRYDTIALDYKDHDDSANDVDPSYDALSYRLGLNYALSKSESIYSNVSTGFRAPTVGQISTNKVALAADPTLNIEANLDVETTYNYEIGFKGKAFSLTYDASIFQLDRKDYIGKIAGSYITSDDDNENGYGNVGDMRSRGFELALQSDKTKMLSFNLAYTYLDATFTDYWISQQLTEDPDGWGPGVATYGRKNLSGNQVSRTSKHTTNLIVNYKPMKNLTISPELFVKGSYYADEINAHKQDGYEVVNLRANYQPIDGIEIFARVDNLLDKKYYSFVNINSSALATMEDDATIRVAPPRAYYAGLRYKF